MTDKFVWEYLGKYLICLLIKVNSHKNMAFLLLLWKTELANDDYKLLHTDNTVVCQVRVSRAAMKAAQEAAKEEREGEGEA